MKETYLAVPDEEIAALFADKSSLTEEAQSALLSEISHRGLTEPQLQKLHSDELRREAQFDRLETVRRKRMVFDSFGFKDLLGWILALIGVILLGLLAKIGSHLH